MKQQLSPTAPANRAKEEHRLIKMCKELYKNDKSSFISITELLRVSTIPGDHWMIGKFEFCSNFISKKLTGLLSTS